MATGFLWAVSGHSKVGVDMVANLALSDRHEGRNQNNRRRRSRGQRHCCCLRAGGMLRNPISARRDWHRCGWLAGADCLCLAAARYHPDVVLSCGAHRQCCARLASAHALSTRLALRAAGISMDGDCRGCVWRDPTHAIESLWLSCKASFRARNVVHETRRRCRRTRAFTSMTVHPAQRF